MFSFQPQSVAVAKTNLRGGVEILARLHFGEKANAKTLLTLSRAAGKVNTTPRVQIEKWSARKEAAFPRLILRLIMP